MTTCAARITLAVLLIGFAPVPTLHGGEQPAGSKIHIAFTLDALNEWLGDVAKGKNGDVWTCELQLRKNHKPSDWIGYINCDSVRGSKARPVLVRRSSSESVVITADPSKHTWALLSVTDCAWVTFDGLRLADNQAKTHGWSVCGVKVGHSAPTRGRSTVPMPGIRLKNLEIDRIKAKFDPELTKAWKADCNANAHGILIESSLKDAPITDLAIEGCHVRECKLGCSEAISINGNIERFSITNCTLSGNDNIGVDAIGGEHAGAAGTSWDSARYGLIAHNLVTNCSSKGNGAYRNEDKRDEFVLCAGGIYVDGADKIVIAFNKVEACDHGIEIGCENEGEIANDITLSGNTILSSNVAGILLGANDDCDKKQGAVEGVVVLGNTVHGPETKNDGALLFQRVRYALIRGNEFRLPPKGKFLSHYLCQGPCHDIVVCSSNTVVYANRPTSALAQPPIYWERMSENQCREARVKCKYKSAGKLPKPRKPKGEKESLSSWEDLVKWLRGRGRGLRWNVPHRLDAR